jgi:hypothetical protein
MVKVPENEKEIHQQPSWLEPFMEKAIHMINRDTTRKKLQLYLIDPLLNHVMERVFPYIVLTCVLFTLLLIFVMLTFGMLVIQHRSVPFSALNMIPLPSSL